MPDLLLSRRLALLRGWRNAPRDTPFIAPAHEPVWITGASSQVGLALIRRLLAAGRRIRACYYRTLLDFTHTQLLWQPMDLSCPFPGDLRLRTLIHAAPLWLLPMHLERMKREGLERVVAVGSSSVLGKAGSLNPREQTLVQRLQDAEEDVAGHCARYGIAWTILRPTMIYGYGLDENVTALAQLIQKRHWFPLSPPASGLRAPLHVEDLACTLLQTLGSETSHGKIYAVCGGEKLMYRTLIERIFQALGLPPRLIPVPGLPLLLPLAGRVTGNPHLTADLARRMNESLVWDDSTARNDLRHAPGPFLKNGFADLGILKENAVGAETLESAGGEGR